MIPVGLFSGSFLPIQEKYPFMSNKRMKENLCVFFNGALHSVAYTLNCTFILCFDVNDERFREIMLLPNNYLDGFCPIFDRLVVFKGSLALVAYGNDLDEGRDIWHIWVMGEYGVVESWAKKCVSMENVWHLFGCTDNGELLIQTTQHGIVSFDPDSLTENDIGIPCRLWLDYTSDFMESLVGVV